MKKNIALAIALVFVFVTVMAVAANAQEKCPLCGMNLADNENTAFVVEKTTGETVTYCCPHCGLWIMTKEADTVKSAKVKDFIGGEWINAKDAVYLYKSKAVPACAPSWIAFATKKEAQMFRKGFGGTVYSYNEAIKKRAGMPQSMSK